MGPVRSAHSRPYLIRDVLRVCSLREARSPRRVPLWGLFLVGFFTQGPLQTAFLNLIFKWLTIKTVFLVFLASGRHGSKAHKFSAMDQDIAFESDGSISLWFLPEFFAKNQQPGTTSPVVVIHPLSSILAPDDEDNYLCPVRTLRRYLLVNRARRTSGLRRLFISLNRGYNADIRAPTFARWVSEAVEKAMPLQAFWRPLTGLMSAGPGQRP